VALYASFLAPVLSYFSRDAKPSLISLGTLQSLGCRYGSYGLHHIVLRDPDGGLLDVACMLDNRIAPVSELRYRSGAALLDESLLPPPVSLLVLPSVPISSVLLSEYPTLVLEELVAMFQCPAQSVMIPQSDHALHSFASFEHVSREQRNRCERVEMVHHSTLLMMMRFVMLLTLVRTLGPTSHLLMSVSIVAFADLAFPVFQQNNMIRLSLLHNLLLLPLSASLLVLILSRCQSRVSGVTCVILISWMNTVMIFR